MFYELRTTNVYKHRHCVNMGGYIPGPTFAKLFEEQNKKNISQF